ncbi:hypothetical protein, partial [Treponema sp. R80B11-R83G3]
MAVELHVKIKGLLEALGFKDVTVTDRKNKFTAVFRSPYIKNTRCSFIKIVGFSPTFNLIFISLYASSA